MKKLYTITLPLLMLLMSSNIYGQDISGSWESSKTSSTDLNISDKFSSSSTFISFSDNKVVAGMHWDFYEKGVGKMTLEFNLPGIYSKTGNNVKCIFRPNDFSMKISSITLDDPELKGVMDSSADMKDYVLSSICEKVHQDNSQTVEYIKSRCSKFENFQIVSVNAYSLTLNVNGKSMAFNKVK